MSRICSRCCRWRCPAWCSASAMCSSSMRSGIRSSFLYGTLLVLVINSIAHFYTVAHITALTALEADRSGVRVGLGLAEGAVLAHLRPRHRADLPAGDPRHRGLYVRQCADHRVGRDLPLRPGHQARLDRDRAHGRDGRVRRRRRHGDHDRRSPRSARSCCRSCSTACCSCACRPGGGDDALAPQRRHRAIRKRHQPVAAAARLGGEAISTRRRARCWPRTRNISCASRSRRPASTPSSRRKASGSRIPPAAATWISTATTCTTSATAIRGSSARSPSRWTRCRSRRAATPAGRRSRSPPSSPRSRRAISSKVLFTTGGSDAVEVAIKIARAATGRYKTLSFWDAFHGAGFGAAAVGGEALFRSGGVGPLMPGAEHVAPYAALPLPLWHLDHRSERGRLRAHDRIRARSAKATSRPSSPSRCARCRTFRRPASGAACARPATGTARC